MPDIVEIRPQEGMQEDMLSCQADIVLGGGGAGSGKTFAALMKPLYYVFEYPGYNCVFFRRTYKEIKDAGGVWDTSGEIYKYFAKANQSELYWQFENGSRVKFSHMQHEKDKESYASSQIATVIFEELQTFTESQFTFMWSRNRSSCGVKPQILATCNPEEGSWILKYIEWYLDDKGYPVPERYGKVRWFIRQGDELIWADTRIELIEKYGSRCLPKSFAFFPSTVKDNKKLLEVNPEYLGNLQALSAYDRKKLLEGCWYVSRGSGMYFKREWFEFIDVLPNNIVKTVRFWDKGGSVPTPAYPDPDYTAGCKMSKTSDGAYIIEDVVRDRLHPDSVLKMIRNTATRDGVGVNIGIEHEGGSSGKLDAMVHTRNLAGFSVKMYRATRKRDKHSKNTTVKEERAKPVSAQCEAGNVKILRGAWNEDFLSELINFPDPTYHDDQIDALSGAFSMLVTNKVTAKANKEVVI